jgi:hypothetical protein
MATYFEGPLLVKKKEKQHKKLRNPIMIKYGTIKTNAIFPSTNDVSC